MIRFAALLDRLSYETGRSAKLALIADYLATTPDPDRGYALAALTGALSFRHAKAGIIRALITERTDPVLFALAYDYVGDLSETVALMWPVPTIPSMTGQGGAEGAGWDHATPALADVVTTLAALSKSALPRQLAQWLDHLDETGRWALLKLVTGGLRVGVSARLAKTALASLGGKEADEIELVWPSLSPPYSDLFAWIEGRGPRPARVQAATFSPMMLAHAIAAEDFPNLDAADFCAEWKWDGVRVQAVLATDADGRRHARLYSRTGEDISTAFPDLLEDLSVARAVRLDDARPPPAPVDATLDGELLILRGGRVQSFNVLQQRLNRKAVTAKLMADYPAHLRAYDLLADGHDDVRPLPFEARRARLADVVARFASPRLDLSPLLPFGSWDELAQARADPAAHGAGDDAEAIEGVMIKRRDAPYSPGRPRGPWWKWKRDPRVVDAVLMYAQRGHGKRSSFYSDYTFGVWTEGASDDELVPVGKAYFGFTDEELSRIDRFVRNNTVDRFGPVREVRHDPDHGLVFEVAFEGLARSPRHKSGIAMRFPRINRLRWDKPPREADRLEALVAMLGDEAEAPPARTTARKR
jgi:DNA ligase-1